MASPADLGLAHCLALRCCNFRRAFADDELRRALTFLGDAIIGPERAGCRAAPGSPGFGERAHLLRGWTCIEAEQQPRCLLQRQIARRPGVGMPEEEQEIAIGSTWPAGVQYGQRTTDVL